MLTCSLDGEIVVRNLWPLSDSCRGNGGLSGSRYSIYLKAALNCWISRVSLTIAITT